MITMLVVAIAALYAMPFWLCLSDNGKHLKRPEKKWEAFWVFQALNTSFIGGLAAIYFMHIYGVRLP